MYHCAACDVLGTATEDPPRCWLCGSLDIVPEMTSPTAAWAWAMAHVVARLRGMAATGEGP
jgi:hypothetical protein